MPRDRYKEKRAHRQPPCPIVPIVGYARHASRVMRGTTRTAKGARNADKTRPKDPFVPRRLQHRTEKDRESKTCLRTILSDYPIMPAALPVSLSEMKRSWLLDRWIAPGAVVQGRRSTGARRYYPMSHINYPHPGNTHRAPGSRTRRAHTRKSTQQSEGFFTWMSLVLCWYSYEGDFLLVFITIIVTTG